jgi:hypothetical protein
VEGEEVVCLAVCWDGKPAKVDCPKVCSLFNSDLESTLADGDSALPVGRVEEEDDDDDDEHEDEDARAVLEEK